MSGKLERLGVTVQPVPEKGAGEEGKHQQKSPEVKSSEVKSSEVKSPVAAEEVKLYDNDNDLPEDIKKELKDFGKSFGSRNTHRKLFEYDKEYNVVAKYKNITDFRNKVDKNFRGSFTYRGQYYNLPSGNKLVAIEPKGIGAILEEKSKN